MSLYSVETNCKDVWREPWGLAVQSGSNQWICFGMVEDKNEGCICLFTFLPPFAWDISYLPRSLKILPVFYWSKLFSKIIWCNLFSLLPYHLRTWIRFKWFFHLFPLLMPWSQSSSLLITAWMWLTFFSLPLAWRLCYAGFSLEQGDHVSSVLMFNPGLICSKNSMWLQPSLC